MKHPVPSKGNARHIAHPKSTSNPIPEATASATHGAGNAGVATRRTLLAAGAALAAAGATPAAAARDADAELTRLADLAADACRGYVANLSGEVVVPAEVEAELDRFAALADDCYHRAAEIRATTPAGLRAKARIVTLANSHNLACLGDTAFVTLESLLDDLMGGEGTCAAFDWHVNRREGAP